MLDSLDFDDLLFEQESKSESSGTLYSDLNLASSSQEDSFNINNSERNDELQFIPSDDDRHSKTFVEIKNNNYYDLITSNNYVYENNNNNNELFAEYDDPFHSLALMPPTATLMNEHPQQYVDEFGQVMMMAVSPSISTAAAMTTTTTTSSISTEKVVGFMMNPLYPMLAAAFTFGTTRELADLQVPPPLSQQHALIIGAPSDSPKEEDHLLWLSSSLSPSCANESLDDENDNNKKKKRKRGSTTTLTNTTLEEQVESKTKKRKAPNKKKKKKQYETKPASSDMTVVTGGVVDSSSSSYTGSDDHSEESTNGTQQQNWYDKLSASATYLELELESDGSLPTHTVHLHTYSTPRRQYGPKPTDLIDEHQHLHYEQTLKISIEPLSKDTKILNNKIYVSLKGILKMIPKPPKKYTWIKVENSTNPPLFLYCQTGKAKGVHNIVNISSRGGTVASRTGILNKYSPYVMKPVHYEFITNHCSETSHGLTIH
ncbi:hypothetical protein FDP41_011270 [Naegleria fowleri]|uniref:Uncharacterized protein n=1 Tax=Naegleria fowleri TaxID=5763 RepID=A0A6A5C9D2_NAEFO|nr:uncharacterized protein FDP41_011270 [Naegleria fowleri]KAF0982340.1 hypothetical protein FDP41_011270 [Naegleria fowleri]CAG4718242.1 unnamed protein product [Naegleria fowleri]